VIISRSALVVATLVGASVGLGGLSLTVLIRHGEPIQPPPPPQIVQPKIDEARIADLIAQKMIAADEARIAAARNKAKKADCAFWGRRMEGCS